MFLDLMVDGKLKMTAELDIENLTHGKRMRKLCELLNVPFNDGSSWHYNFFNEGKKFFNVVSIKKKNLNK